jgi:molecular chaperone GrpE
LKGELSLAEKKNSGEIDREAVESENEKEKVENEKEIISEDAEAQKEEGGGSEEKRLSETDILKIYLEQAIGELKRSRAEIEKLKKQAEEFKSQAEQYKNKLGRMADEYDNFRRRTATEKDCLYAEAVASVVASLLPALDSLEKALGFSSSNPDGFRQGVELTLKQLTDGFSLLGVKEIEAQGQKFDPEKHNAVIHVKDKNLGESVVTEVFQKGYEIGDRVIRHSVVKVAN